MKAWLVWEKIKAIVFEPTQSPKPWLIAYPILLKLIGVYREHGIWLSIQDIERPYENQGGEWYSIGVNIESRKSKKTLSSFVP